MTRHDDPLFFHFVDAVALSQEQLSLDSRLESLCQSFISHNLLTGNLGSLIIIFLNKVALLLELSDHEMYVVNDVYPKMAFKNTNCLITVQFKCGKHSMLCSLFDV